jgi:predicted TIM-barrel fold metal-dependent hydrolase
MSDSTGYKLISADSHGMEPPDLFQKRLPAGLRARAPKLAPWEGGSAWMIDGLDPVPLPPTAATGSGYRLSNRPKGKPISHDEVLPALRDPAERIKAQNADGVDAEVLYPSPALWDAIKLLDDVELKTACVRAYNDWIAEFCSHNPNRLIGLGKIPVGSVDEACAELKRCTQDLELRGVILDSWPSGAAVGGSPEEDPFWAAVNEAKVPVSLHFAVGPKVDTLPPGGIAPGLRPQMAEGTQPLLAAGIFDRFPNVRLVFSHGDASWALHWLEFSDINYLRMGHLGHSYNLKEEGATPSSYLRRHIWFTFHHDRPAMRNLDNLGRAHLMWASHFPYDDSDWPDNRQHAIRVTGEAPAEVREALMAGNVARLYRLPGYEAGFTDEAVRDFVDLVHY